VVVRDDEELHHSRTRGDPLEEELANNLDEKHRMFFVSGDHLPQVQRLLYIFAASIGTVLVFFMTLFVVAEITTHPRLSAWSVRLGVLAAIVSIVHLVRCAVSLKPLKLAEWLAFAIAMGSLTYEIQVNIQDPTARTMFTFAGAIGSLLLLLARWLCTRSLPDDVHPTTRR
jgi:hypothetical protein